MENFELNAIIKLLVEKQTLTVEGMEIPAIIRLRTIAVPVVIKFFKSHMRTKTEDRNKPATEEQKGFIRKMLSRLDQTTAEVGDYDKMTRQQACTLIEYLKELEKQGILDEAEESNEKKEESSRSSATYRRSMG